MDSPRSDALKRTTRASALVHGIVISVSRVGSAIAAHLRYTTLGTTQAPEQRHGPTLARCCNWFTVSAQPLQGQGSVGAVEIILLAKQQP
jgi:hypothetical protein